MATMSNPVVEAVGPPAMPSTTVAATGADSAGAALLSPGINYVTDADDALGVRIPNNSKGKTFVIINSVSGKNLIVYPPTGGTINYELADATLTVAGRKSCEIEAYTDLIVYSTPLVPS